MDISLFPKLKLFPFRSFIVGISCLFDPYKVFYGRIGRNGAVSSDDEAFFHRPRFCPHRRKSGSYNRLFAILGAKITLFELQTNKKHKKVRKKEEECKKMTIFVREKNHLTPK